MKISTLFAALTMLVLSPVIASAQDIRIGVAGPMTGSERAFGAQIRRGAEAAVADINAAGGVLGRKLSIEIGDDGCDRVKAASVATSLANLQVPFVVGHFCSSSSVPASEIYAANNIVQITPASTNPYFTERQLWNVFRVCGRDDQQGIVAADYIARNFKGRKIAILHDQSIYGKGVADTVKNALNKAGIKESVYSAFSKEGQDVLRMIPLLKSGNVDLVYIGGYHREAALLRREMRDQGIQARMIGADALNDREFASLAGSATEDVLFTFGPDPRTKPSATAVVSAARAMNIDPEGYFLYTYAAVQVWAGAVSRIGSLDARRVAQAIKAGTANTVLGTLSFDAKGDIKHLDYVIYRFDSKGGYAELRGAGLPSVATAAPQPASPPAATPRPPSPAPTSAVPLLLRRLPANRALRRS
jgi:branched-chain amino acid transport system substrate-binding protein